MGERFTAASRPEPGQWAAVEGALGLCGTQPSACPQAPQLTCQAPQLTHRPEARKPGGPGEKAAIHTLTTVSDSRTPAS